MTMKLRRQRDGYASRETKFLRLVVYLFAIAGLLAAVNIGLEVIQDKYYPKPTEVLSPIVVEELELTEIEKVLLGLSEVERKICETFPITECKIALAVQQSENGTQNPERYYVEADGEISVGIFQIKAENWNSEDCPYGLSRVATVEPNIECAYNIWDRCDGERGNNKGCWREWGTYNNRSFVSNLE